MLQPATCPFCAVIIAESIAKIRCDCNGSYSSSVYLSILISFFLYSISPSSLILASSLDSALRLAPI